MVHQVNGSGHFCGLAEMVGPVDFHKDMDFWCQDKWTGCFPVRWHIIKDVPNYTLQNILLQNNENKPVTHSRDTQEVSIPFVGSQFRSMEYQVNTSFRVVKCLHIAFFFHGLVLSIHVVSAFNLVIMIQASNAGPIRSWNICAQDLEGYQSEGVPI